MKNQELAEIKKMNISELLKLKAEFQSENIKENAKLASTGAKGSKKTKENKKKVAWIETVITMKILEINQPEKDKNGE